MCSFLKNIYGRERKITPAILTFIISAPAYRGELKKYLPITSTHVTATIHSKTIPANMDIKRLTLKVSRSIMLSNCNMNFLQVYKLVT